MQIETFKKLCAPYRAIFFDAYGVLNGEQGAFDFVRPTIDWLREIGKPFLVLTNDSSVPIARLAMRYTADERPYIKESEIICSGLIAQHYLMAHHSGARIVYIGQEQARCFLTPASSHVVVMEQADIDELVDVFAVMSVSGYDWQTTFNKAVNYLRAHPNAHLIAPNPDLLYFAGGTRVGIAAGGIAAFFEALLERKFTYFGKPFPAIFEHGLRLHRQKIPDLQPHEVLMVGDNLLTDIAGARKMGCKSALVLSGNTTLGELTNAKTEYFPDHICQSIALD